MKETTMPTPTHINLSLQPRVDKGRYASLPLPKTQAVLDAAKEVIESYPGGGPFKTPHEMEVFVLASKLNIGTTSIRRCFMILKKGTPQLFDAVYNGEISLQRGGDIATQVPMEYQDAAIHASPVKRNKRNTTTTPAVGKYRPAIANDAALKAVTLLMRITDDDLQAAEAFQSVINYATGRLNRIHQRK
jgi:hypothetical protein